MKTVTHLIEGTVLLNTIISQPLFGVLASILAGLYYGSMTKINIVDVKYGGSWKSYFKSFLKYFKS